MSRSVLLAVVALIGSSQGSWADAFVGCYPCDSLSRRYFNDTNSPWATHDSLDPLSRQGFEWMRFGVTATWIEQFGLEPGPWRSSHFVSGAASCGLM